MGGIAKGTEIRVMRRYDERFAAGTQQAVEFLHGLDYVGDVLDHMNGLQFIEGGIAEGVREAVEVAEDIGAGSGVAVDADGAREFVDATADVEYGHRM